MVRVVAAQTVTNKGSGISPGISSVRLSVAGLLDRSHFYTKII